MRKYLLYSLIIIFPMFGVSNGFASSKEILKSLQYGLTYHWGGLTPYGDDDANTNGSNGYWDPTQPTASPTTDFDDIFGQPKGHAICGKLSFLYNERYGLRFGYEGDNFRTEFTNGVDSQIVWKILKNDLSTELTWGKPLGGVGNNFYPYLFSGLSFVYYGENISLLVNNLTVDSESSNILSSVVGFNLGGGLKFNLFYFLDLGVEVWHQWKDFSFQKGPQPTGAAKELSGRLLIGIHFGPFKK